MKFLLLILSFNLFANCIETRAGIDIGSGASKLKISEFNKCLNEIGKVVFVEDYNVEYKDDLKTRNKNYFSLSIIKKGKKVLEQISKKLIEFKVKRVKAVATSAFRTSTNSDEIVSYAKTINIPIQVISQKEEAILGYQSAKSLAKGVNYLVWDIGGGSMQMIYKDGEKLVIYEGKLASVPFRAHVTKFIQKSNSKSPNPMSANDVSKSIAYAKNYALKDVNKEIQDIASKIDIIGIGGVHSSAILEAMGKKDTYTYSELNAFLNKRKYLTDKQIGGKYASTSTSNLALVLGFMQALGIKQVRSGKVNLSDGLLYNN